MSKAIWKLPETFDGTLSSSEESFEDQLVNLGFTKPKGGRNIIWDERGPTTWSVSGKTSVTTPTSNSFTVNDSEAMIHNTEAPMYKTFDNTHLVDSLRKDIEAMKDTQDRLIEDNDRLKLKNEVQQNNFNVISEAHDDLRKVLKEMSIVPATTHQMVEGYRKSVKDLQEIVKDKNSQIEQLESTNTELNCAIDDLNDLTDHLNEKAYHPVKVDTIKPVGPSSEEWDKLSLDQKFQKLEAGQTVWSASTGKGPLRTLVGGRATIGKQYSTFGMTCRDHLGDDKDYPISDLIPARPAMRPRPSKVNLLVSTLAGSVGAAYVAYLTFGPKGALIAGAAQTIVSLIHMREYAKI